MANDPKKPTNLQKQVCFDESCFEPERVELPRRFQKMSESDTGSRFQCEAKPDDEDIDIRRGDIQQALLWLKQEVLLLKQQDRALTRRFLGLGAKIHQLRGVRPKIHPNQSFPPAFDDTLTGPSFDTPFVFHRENMLQHFRPRAFSMPEEFSSDDDEDSPSRPPSLQWEI